MFDPEKFGEAMGAAIRDAIAPLQKKLAEIESQLAKDVPAQIERSISAAVEALPAPKDGIDADPILIIKEVLAQIPSPLKGDIGESGKDGLNGKDGKDGEKGEKGADGLGLAGAMIDREGALQITMTNGEVKNLGKIVGKDGTDGRDGISFDSFEIEYLPESHEMSVKATAAGRTKEVRYPAGGIRSRGYWRDGTKAAAGEAWVHDGSLWIATKDTMSKPETKGSDWIIGARKGRDGEVTVKTINGAPPGPIKLQA